MDGSAEAKRVVADAARLVGTGELIVFGSSALAFWMKSPPRSKNVDVWCVPETRGDALAALMGELSWYHEKHGMFVEVWAPETFAAPADWRTRSERLLLTENKAVSIVLPHPHDVMMAKLERMELKDREHVRAAGGLLPEPIAAHPDVVASLRTFVTLVGDAWGDPLANTRIDQELLGIGTLVVLLGLVWAGDRSGVARDRAAPWWSCALFGLLVLAAAVMRYDEAPPSGTWREATIGAFLLPLGVVGVAACRFGVGWLRFCAGAAAVLLVQDWHRGIEDLRLARAKGERVAAAMALPPEWRTGAHSPSPMRNEAEVAAARGRGDVPAPAAMTGAATGPAVSGLGRIDRGDATALHGHLRSTLVGNPVHVVAAFDPARGDTMLAAAWPDFDAAGRFRDVPWTLHFATSLAEGVRLRVVGYRPSALSFVSLGADLVLRGGALVPEESK